MKFPYVFLLLGILIIKPVAKAQGWQAWRNNAVHFTGVTVIGEDDVYLTADILGFPGEIITTQNLGQSWSSLHQVPGSILTRNLVSDGHGTMYFSVFNANSRLCEIYRSADTFNTVVSTLNDSLAWSIIDIDFSQGQGYAVGWRCKDTSCNKKYPALYRYQASTGSWLSDSLRLPNIYGLQLLDSNTIYAWSFSQFIIHSKDGGTTWDTITSPLPQNVKLRAFYMQSDSVAYCASENDKIYRTADTGQSWTVLSNINARVNQIAGLGDFVLFTTDFEGRVIYTPDNGNNWITDPVPSTQQMTDVEITSEGIFISASLGYVFYHDASIFPGVSIEENSVSGELSLYPNPAGEKVFISGTTGPQMTMLIDGHGKVIFKGRINSGKGIDLSTVAKGIYTLSCTDSKGVVKTARIIKN